MLTLEMTDADLQRLLGDALRRKLARAGFRPGAPSDQRCAWEFHVILDLAPSFAIERSPDGVWRFTQEDPAVEARVLDSYVMHGEAMLAREGRHA